MSYSPRITKEELDILKQCIDENKSVTIMMVKVKRSRSSILTALRKHFGLSRKQADALGN